MKLFFWKRPINEEKLGQKLKLAKNILKFEMEPRKEKACLDFIKGMVELTKREEKLYDKRLAEMKIRR